MSIDDITITFKIVLERLPVWIQYCNLWFYSVNFQLGTVHFIFCGGGGGGSKKNSLFWFWLKKTIILLNDTVKKIICLQWLPTLTYRHVWDFKSKNVSGSLHSPEEYQILRARRLSSKLLKQGYLAERLKSSFGMFYCRYGDLIQQYEVPLSRMLNAILILDQQWLPNQSDFPPISWPWYRAWPSPIMSGFHGHLVPSPIVGLACAPIVETRFLELAMSLLDFSPRIPLGTFSILLLRLYLNATAKTWIECE